MIKNNKIYQKTLIQYAKKFGYLLNKEPNNSDIQKQTLIRKDVILDNLKSKF
jgi:hypothetical protein